MNEKRFLELLNLHLDGEISPPEQEELEREIAQNSRRHETYRSYCRLQEASQQAYQDFGEALTETVDLKKYQILARSSTRCCLRRGLLYSSSALAAACLTVLAAVTVFQDAQREPLLNAAPQEGFAQVEVLDPDALNVRQRGRYATFEGIEPLIFAGRPTFFDRTPDSAAFFPAVEPALPIPPQDSPWQSFLPSNSSTRVFSTSSSTFQATPELSSFKFQR